MATAKGQVVEYPVEKYRVMLKTEDKTVGVYKCYFNKRTGESIGHDRSPVLLETPFDSTSITQKVDDILRDIRNSPMFDYETGKEVMVEMRVIHSGMSQIVKYSLKSVVGYVADQAAGILGLKAPMTLQLASGAVLPKDEPVTKRLVNQTAVGLVRVGE